jgi:N-acyl amino acid synthase of PEP-CTERM/exosortase system
MIQVRFTDDVLKFGFHFEGQVYGAMMAIKQIPSYADEFRQYFRIRLATTETLINEAYKIRHAVYSDELGWEPKRPDRRETDKYDGHALHCVLQHRRTGAFAGCVRLIASTENNKVPFEENCLDAIDKKIINPFKLPRGSFGEISRLAVPATFRKRKNERNRPYVIGPSIESYSEEERRHFANIAVGLYLASIACVDLMGMDHVFVMMEPRLRRHLVRFGLPFMPAGKPIDYHGYRGLFYLDKERLTSAFPPHVRALYELIYSSLKGAVRSPVSTAYSLVS